MVDYKKEYDNYVQYVRILDVVLIGPLMILGGLVMANQGSREMKLYGYTLVFFGISTVVFNFLNYKKDL